MVMFLKILIFNFNYCQGICKVAAPSGAHNQKTSEFYDDDNNLVKVETCTVMEGDYLKLVSASFESLPCIEISLNQYILFFTCVRPI